MTDPLSAPSHIRFCCRCAGSMHTRVVAGKPRRVCTQCRYVHFIEPKVGVGVMVTDPGGQLLLVQRRMPPEQGKWSLPAGYVDYGEDPRTSAVREASEETALSVEISGLIDVYNNPPEQGGASIFILYRARVTGGQLCAGDDAGAVAFFSLDHLPELAFKSTVDAVQRLLNPALVPPPPR